MKKNLSLFVVISFFLAPSVFAQAGMMDYQNYNYSTGINSNNDIVQLMDGEELAGQTIAQKLKVKTSSCADLSEDNYESLGDYYMGLMMGTNHETMDRNIKNNYGDDYLRSMHIAMGERFSGCNANVSFPAGMMGFGPMMGGWNMMRGFSYPVGGLGNFGFGGSVVFIIVWILAIAGMVFIVKWLLTNSKK